MQKKHDPLENLLSKVDDLDTASRSNLIDRLARERRLLNSVFNTLKEGVLVMEASGELEYANASALEMLGLEGKDISIMNLWKAVPDLARTLKLERGGYLREVANLSREVELTYPERRLVRVYMVPFETETVEVEIARYAVILSDITQEESKNRQEIESERIDSILQLSAGVAHELGNPLNSLNIHLQVLKRNLAKTEAFSGRQKIEKSIDICMGEVERLDRIITHFLGAVRPQDLDLSDLYVIYPLEESIEFLGPELEGAGIRVDVELESDLPIVLGDKSQLKQVFFNLLKNARQAMNDGGVIKVRAFNDDEFVYIQIGDNGAGISQEDLPKVFQPYYSTKKGGHGLGMMIVERIIRDHGGKVGIDSRTGVGTLVTLQIPQKHRRVRMIAAKKNE